MIHFLSNNGMIIAAALNIIAIIAMIFATVELRKALRLMDSRRESVDPLCNSASFTANQEDVWKFMIGTAYTTEFSRCDFLFVLVRGA